MVQVKFTTFGANSAFGSFGPGDVMRCSPAMAKHLVEEMACAKYVEAVTAAPEEVEQPIQKKRGKKAE